MNERDRAVRGAYKRLARHVVEQALLDARFPMCCTVCGGTEADLSRRDRVRDEAIFFLEDPRSEPIFGVAGLHPSTVREGLKRIMRTAGPVCRAAKRDRIERCPRMRDDYTGCMMERVVRGAEGDAEDHAFVESHDCKPEWFYRFSTGESKRWMQEK